MDSLELRTPETIVLQERPRYVIHNAAYALQPQPPVEEVVEGLIHRGDLILPYGESGSKKTYAMLSLAVCVNLGKDWLGFKTTKTKVLIIDEESGERRLSRRLGEAIRGELGNENINLEYVCRANFKLDDPDDVVLLQSLIEETGAGLVLIDALCDVMSGDENSKQDTQPIFTALQKIADVTNAAIIVIHHSNKTGGYRGSSAIKGAVDLMIEIKSEQGSSFISFKTMKERDIERARWEAEAVWTDCEFYLKPADRRKEETRERELYVMRYLAEHGASTVTDITAAANGCTPGGAKQGIYALAKQGKIKRTNPGDRKAIYELAEPVTRYETVTLPLP